MRFSVSVKKTLLHLTDDNIFTNWISSIVQRKNTIYCYLRKDRFEGRDDFLAGSFLFSLYDKLILIEETPHDKDLVTKCIYALFNLIIFQQLLINNFLQEKTMSF